MVHALWNGVRRLLALSFLELTIIRARVVNKQLRLIHKRVVLH